MAVALKPKTATQTPPAVDPTADTLPPSPPDNGVDLALLGELPIFRRWPRRLNRVVYLLQAWEADGRLSRHDQAVMLCIAYMESGYNLNAISGPDAPDAAVGDAHSMFQITGQTAQGLGIDIRELRAFKDANGQLTETETQRATYANADAAIKLLVTKTSFSRPDAWLTWLSDRYGNDPALVARGIFIRWSGGPARGWDYSYADGRRPLVDVAPNPESGTGGYIHYQLARRFRMLPYFQRALGLEVALPGDLKIDPAGESVV